MMAETDVYSVNVEVQLIEWVDANYAAQGYSSRSRYVNAAIKEKKQRDQKENDDQ